MLRISDYVKTQAEKTVDVMVVSGEDTKPVIEEEDFFVSRIRKQPEGVIYLYVMKRGEVEYFLCQKIR